MISKIQLKVEQTLRRLTQMKRTRECYIIRKVHPRTGHEGEGECRYSSTLSLNSALDGVVGQRHGPAALPPGNIPGTHSIGGWVGPRPGLGGSRKTRPHRDSIPGPSSP